MLRSHLTPSLRRVLLGGLLLATGGAALASPKEGELPHALLKSIDRIAEQSIHGHLAYLTSEVCAGRDTPSPGLAKAAEYIIRHYQSLGMPGAAPGSDPYRLNFSLEAVQYDPLDYVAVHTGGPQGELTVYSPGEDFVPVRGSASGEVEGEVVFAGYGIYDEGERYDDFRGETVKDRIVLLLSHEPRQNQRGRAFRGTDFTEHSAIDRKSIEAARRGARAVLIVTNPANHDDLSTLRAEHPRVDPPRGPDYRRAEIPVVHISGKIAEALIGLDELLARQKALDRKLKGDPELLKGVTVRLKITMKKEPMEVPNIVAIREGDDPERKQEWVVLGAHYDHLGTDPYGRIYHGADDNGSGTSCLLEVARTLSDPEVKIGRSILFISFAGEEDGLLGAHGYAKAPLVPFADTVAMLNMDMLGRGRPNDVSAIGADDSRDFTLLLKEAVDQTRTRLRIGTEGKVKYFERSDQLVFWQNGIPALFFMEPEEHEDYHRITDTPDKVDEKKVVKVARVVAALTYLIGERAERIRAKTGKD